MKKNLLIILAVISLNAVAQQDTLKYRIYLTDKNATTYSLQAPEAYLSEKAIARRARQQLPVDSTDLPVCDAYINAIRNEGVTIVAKGKWENFVTVSCKDTTRIDRIAALPFVKSAKHVWTVPKKEKKKNVSKRDSLSTDLVRQENIYGLAFTQIQQSGGERLHQAGFRGEGMTIAVMDAGYQNADRIAAFQNTRILGTKDFVDRPKNEYNGSSHGLMVFSCMAANLPHVMIGTAPEASYWLFGTEDERSEQLVEQDYWAAAVEFADSVGVDLINTSLGYTSFDDKSKNYRLRDLDGTFSLISRQASRVADKGMVMVCSAGNSGQGSWKKITPPADAFNVITVGAINDTGMLANFSSIGNTTDNRVKPDVVALGIPTQVIATNGRPSTANGTSFATPVMCGMVACLWQARPELTAKQIITLVRRSGDRADFPDNIYGYGIPDLWEAYTTQGEIGESVD